MYEIFITIEKVTKAGGIFSTPREDKVPCLSLTVSANSKAEAVQAIEQHLAIYREDYDVGSRQNTGDEEDQDPTTSTPVRMREDVGVTYDEGWE